MKKRPLIFSIHIQPQNTAIHFSGKLNRRASFGNNKKCLIHFNY